ncbi:hypothetical protein PV325_011845 [Microctonus aethiopoides]|uniref:Uncharacterized protein n=1 Tax=Microctonus aethiopoides TaxID=144406 RepID=A0AA39FAX4_9HYME|nr:hypothetical protein PV325_011845 [Microctonus aethiopoides]KAK0094908.1 hypothetical protein PV326_009653 [Microctonus aethiopoides]KAK0166190.1 hypothetical protein PV328_004631 [Microctonus aethiopoides]
MSMSQFNSYDTSKDGKTQQLTEGQRLDKLEKEVCCLRTDLDKIKWEQSIAEAAIGRAIIRGSVSLGGYSLVPEEQNGQDKDKNMKFENCPIDPALISKLPKSQSSSENSYSPNETTIKSRKNQKDDEYFTLG